jgi:hypothetical protein
VENIAGYVFDHTTCDPRRWGQLEADQRGPYFVSSVHNSRRAEFLRLMRSHVEKNRCCDPLNGRVHTLKEITRWIGIRELALRFIGLGVILEIFELDQPWVRREQENHEDMLNRLERGNEVRFRAKVRPVPSVSTTCTGVYARSAEAENGTMMMVASSVEHALATLPRSSSTTTPRSRYMSRNARQLACPNAWPSGRSGRFRRSS